MLDSPNSTVDDELELRSRKSDESWRKRTRISSSVVARKHVRFELTRETELIHSSKELEEPNSMLGVLGEILVDHVESALESCVEDRRDLVGEKRLREKVRTKTRGQSRESFDSNRARRRTNDSLPDE